MARKPAILFDCTRCFNSNAVQHAKFLIEISLELSAHARGGREESFFSSLRKEESISSQFLRLVIEDNNLERRGGGEKAMPDSLAPEKR